MLQAVGKLFRGGLILLAAGAAGLAQEYSISTVAGAAPLAPPATATATGFSSGLPARVTADANGNFYFSSLNAVFKVSAAGVLTRVAGTTHAGFSGDGGPAVNAQLNAPQGLAVDSHGNLYIADSLNNRVRMVSAAGIITTFAGNGDPGSLIANPLSPTGPQLGDGGPATQANLHLPSGVAVDVNGFTFAAQGACPPPAGGCVYIADTSNNAIRMVGADGIMRTAAGVTFTYGYGGDAGYPPPPAAGTTPPPVPPHQAAFAEFRAPEDVFVDSPGNVLIADSGNSLIRRVTTDGNINYIMGSPSYTSYYGDGASALLAGLDPPFSVTVDLSGNVYEVEPAGSRLRKLDATGNINSICGNQQYAGFAGDGGPASLANLNMPTGVAVDPSGNIYVADTRNGRIRELFAGKGSINTVAGDGVYSFSGDGGPANQALMNLPQGVAVDAAGNIYFSDSGNNVVREVAASGAISTIAGASAQLNAPEGVAVDKLGNVYIADSMNHRVLRVSNGAISTFAGTGTAGSAGDGGAAASAQLNMPFGLTFDGAGNLYITEFGGNRVRKVSAANGTISTFAGTGVSGYSGDGLQAVNAQLNGPKAVAVDTAGNVYIADTNNYVVRMVAGGVMSTAAGNGTAGYSGDLGLATAAQLASPSGVAVDSAGGLYIADGGTHVRKVYPGGSILTVAGNGSLGYSGDGGPAASAQLNRPAGVAIAASGALYVADAGNNAIRLMMPLTNIGAVTNAASNLPGPIAPGEVVVIYGQGLGPTTLATSQLNASGRVATSLAGTTVLFNGTPGPVIYAWSTQVAAVVPYSVTGTSVQAIVQYQGQATGTPPVALAPSAPALFTLNYSGTGQAAAVNQDGTLNTAGNPAQAGSYITLYETGEGQTNPAGTDGLLGSAPLPTPALPVTVTIGGQNANVLSAGGIQGVVAGMMQITAQIPSGIAAGNVAVVAQVGTASSQSGVTIAVK